MLRLVTDNIIGYLTSFMFMEGELEMKIVPFWVNEHTQCFSWRLFDFYVTFYSLFYPTFLGQQIHLI